jgi:hypothetical protein
MPRAIKMGSTRDMWRYVTDQIIQEKVPTRGGEFRMLGEVDVNTASLYSGKRVYYKEKLLRLRDRFFSLPCITNLILHTIKSKLQCSTSYSARKLNLLSSQTTSTRSKRDLPGMDDEYLQRMYRLRFEQVKQCIVLDVAVVSDISQTIFVFCPDDPSEACASMCQELLEVRNLATLYRVSCACYVFASKYAHML